MLVLRAKLLAKPFANCRAEAFHSDKEKFGELLLPRQIIAALSIIFQVEERLILALIDESKGLNS
jgi:hypothetical protein